MYDHKKNTSIPDSTGFSSSAPHLQDYSQSREKLMRILTQRDAASSAYDLRKLSLHELIKKAFGVLHGLLIYSTHSPFFNSPITMCFVVDKGDQDSSELAQLGQSFTADRSYTRLFTDRMEIDL
jgi:hypothetical protein